MPTAPRSVLHRRLVPVRWLALLIWLNACFTWRPAQLTPAHRFGRGDQVRVERSNQRRTVLLEPQIVADTLVGHTHGSERRVAIALSDVKRAETLHFNGKKTAISIVVILAALAAFAALAVSDMEYSMGSQPLF